MRVVICLAVMLGMAHADDIDPFDAPHGDGSRGTTLFVEGRALLKQGNTEAACQRFAQSWAIEKALGTQLNLANCREQEGRLVDAYELFDGAAKVAFEKGDKLRATFATQRAAALEDRLAKVTIKLATPIAQGTVVTINGDVVATAQVIEQHVDPQQVRVAATGPTGVLSSKAIVLAPGQAMTFNVPRLHERPGRRKMTWIIASLAFVGVGGYALSQELPTLGATCIGIGAVVFILAPKRRGPVVVPMTVSAGGGAAVAGRF